MDNVQQIMCKALEGGRLGYKVLDHNNQSSNGGCFDWSDYLPTRTKPGKWTPKTQKAAICQCGYHVTQDPAIWLGNVVYVCETDVGILDPQKSAYHSVRLLRRVRSQDCIELRMYVRVRFPFLSWANLRGADLTGAKLTRADLTGADLSWADLTGAHLYGAYLSGADLSGANLRGADLNGANLYGADLRGANLNGANLNGANLTRADLRRANLTGTNLTEVHLDGANLNRAYLIGAYLTGAYRPENDIPGWSVDANGLLRRV
jgi:hypothetical protein